MCSVNQGGAPNYYPNCFGGPNADPNAEEWTPPPQNVAGSENYYPEFYEDDNYSQPRVFWENVLDEAAKNRLVIASTISRIIGTSNGTNQFPHIPFS